MGGGILYKRKLDFFFIDVRYATSLTNMANIENRIDAITFQWNYIDDDFRLDNLAVNIGYIHPFYAPRKLKRARTKSILRDIKKEDHGAQ